jgi:hypothetical protein
MRDVFSFLVNVAFETFGCVNQIESSKINPSFGVVAELVVLDCTIGLADRRSTFPCRFQQQIDIIL